jgi:hypothetical protein
MKDETPVNRGPGVHSTARDSLYQVGCGDVCGEVRVGGFLVLLLLLRGWLPRWARAAVHGTASRPWKRGLDFHVRFRLMLKSAGGEGGWVVGLLARERAF